MLPGDTPPDVIIPVRAGEANEELRFALRSLDANLPHGRVWVVGFKPSWVTGVEFIPGNDAPHARANLWRNLWRACSHPDMPDDVIIMNDDFYILGALERVPVLYRGPLSEQVSLVVRNAGRSGWWQDSLRATHAALVEAGYPDPVSYELHTPFPCSAVGMRETLERFAQVTPHNPAQWRTLYGVTHAIGGSQARDCKATRPGPIRRPFHSTNDLSWRHFRNAFARLFPEPSRYERPPAPAVRASPRQYMTAARHVAAR